MSDKILPKKKVIRLKHLVFGIIILISGILIGFVGGAYTVGKHSDFFRPKPGEISRKISENIVRNFPCLQDDQDNVQNLINNEFSKFRQLSEEVSYRILQMQHDIALEIADIIPNQEDRERWMDTFPEYFPGHKHRLHRAKRFEDRQKCKPSGCMLQDWDRPQHHKPNNIWE